MKNNDKIKVNVWTGLNLNLEVTTRVAGIDSYGGRRKCVFKGKISGAMAATLSKDVGIVVRDGFCVESIDYIYCNLIDNTMEIGLETKDSGNEYGDCLMYPKRKELDDWSNKAW